MLRTPLSAYERERQENIKRNNEVLAALGLEKLGTAPQQQTSKKTSKKRPHDIPSDLKPRRKSARNKGSKEPMYKEDSDEDDDGEEDDDSEEDSDSDEDSDASSGCWVEYDENEPHDPTYDRHFTSSPSSPSSSSSSSSSSSLSPSFNLSSSYSSSSSSSTSSWSPASSISTSSYSTPSSSSSSSSSRSFTSSSISSSHEMDAKDEVEMDAVEMDAMDEEENEIFAMDKADDWNFGSLMDDEFFGNLNAAPFASAAAAASQTLPVTAPNAPAAAACALLFSGGSSRALTSTDEAAAAIHGSSRALTSTDEAAAAIQSSDGVDEADDVHPHEDAAQVCELEEASDDETAPSSYNRQPSSYNRQPSSVKRQREQNEELTHEQNAAAPEHSAKRRRGRDMDGVKSAKAARKSAKATLDDARAADEAKKAAAAQGITLVTSSANETGFKCVTKHHGKYRVNAWDGKKLIIIGSGYTTVGDAAISYAKWAAAQEAEEKEPVKKPLSEMEVVAIAAAEGLELVRSTKNKGTGFRGVYPRDGKFRVVMFVDGQAVHPGTFQTPWEAALCYARIAPPEPDAARLGSPATHGSPTPMTTSLLDAPSAPSAPVDALHTMSQKVARIKVELSLDNSLLVAEAIAQANTTMGIEGQGTLSQQAEILLRELGVL